MPNDTIMPRWATVGTEVSQIHHYSGSVRGPSSYEGRGGKITRVLKSQVEVEFPIHRQDDPNATILVKFKLRRGYKPFGEGNVRVDILEEMGSKWNSDVIWPTKGKSVAQLRIAKEILQNSSKMQGITNKFTKKNTNHIGLADIAELMTELQEVVEERKALEERILDIDQMPQDR